LNPRKFIEEEREVVNAAMARNTTPEAIRHLMQHSNLIDKVNPDGTVIPNRILNVFKEESLNTYENRFVYTLILELQRFINKRFNVIFDDSKDERGTFFEMESLVDNYTEVIDYKLEIKIREKQTDVDNDEENMGIFTRISKIHRQVNDLASGGFATIMQDYPLVRHPIVKTNAIGKNQNYMACHKLWNYIHAYDRIGYKVNMVKSEPVITRQFERDIYNMASSGCVLTADVLSEKYYDLNKKYFGDNVVVDDEVRYEWARIPHFYYNFYVYKYSTGLSAACHIVNDILSGKEGAVDNYIEFLKCGRTKNPIESLKIAGVDLTKKETIVDAIEMFDSVILEFRSIYNKLNNK